MALRDRLGALSGAGETTVSEEDNQGVRHRVICDRLLVSGRRCGRHNDHAGACVSDPTV